MVASLFGAAALACGGNTPSRPTPTQTTALLAGTPPVERSCVAASNDVSTPRLSVTRLLAFGDSMTAGALSTSLWDLLAAPQQGYPPRLQALLAARYLCQTINVVNEGRGGEWAADGERRLSGLLVGKAFDVVMLMEGANDLNAMGQSGMTATLRSIDAMMQNAAGANARVLVATLPPQRPDGLRGGAASLVPVFNDNLKVLAAARRAVVVDVYAAFGGDLTLLGSDGLHPTEAGYDRIAAAFFGVLRTNFEIPATIPTH